VSKHSTIDGQVQLTSETSIGSGFTFLDRRDRTVAVGSVGTFLTLGMGRFLIGVAISAVWLGRTGSAVVCRLAVVGPLDLTEAVLDVAGGRAMGLEPSAFCCVAGSFKDG